MEAGELLTIIGTIGGIEGIVHFAKWWFSRKATKRQDEATAEAAENRNDREQVDWLEKRLMERDNKIDSIYGELRTTQSKHMEEIHRHHETQLKLQDAECKKCLKRGCGDRIPPSEY